MAKIASSSAACVPTCYRFCNDRGLLRTIFSCIDDVLQLEPRLQRNRQLPDGHHISQTLGTMTNARDTGQLEGCACAEFAPGKEREKRFLKWQRAVSCKRRSCAQLESRLLRWGDVCTRAEAQGLLIEPVHALESTSNGHRFEFPTYSYPEKSFHRLFYPNNTIILHRV